nr:hypothetical protein [uncultured Arsenicibacter sp.]
MTATMLTTEQTALLRQHLDSLDIHYCEAFDEFLAQYTALTESGMLTGLSFEEAHTKAYADMGGRYRLYDQQTQLEKTSREQLDRQHWEIIISFFRWPRITILILFGVVVYKATEPVPLGELHIAIMLLLAVFSVTDLFLSVVNSLHYLTHNSPKRRRSIRRRFFRKGMFKLIAPPFWFFHYLFANLTLRNPPVKEPSHIRFLLIVMVTLAALYGLSLLQVYRATEKQPA